MAKLRWVFLEMKLIDNEQQMLLQMVKRSRGGFRRRFSEAVSPTAEPVEVRTGEFNTLVGPLRSLDQSQTLMLTSQRINATSGLFGSAGQPAAATSH